MGYLEAEERWCSLVKDPFEAFILRRRKINNKERERERKRERERERERDKERKGEGER